MRTAVEQTIQGTQPIIQKKIHSNLVYHSVITILAMKWWKCYMHLDLQIYLGFLWILFNNWKTMWWLPVVPLIFWIEGFFFRIDGKWSERSERPFRRGFRGPRQNDAKCWHLGISWEINKALNLSLFTH